ncbi:MAG: hypothetical protein JRE71_19845 [Deltaproteobacteria bacterium]|nr:hypothetical protein [Deltaproteobacteria bacterium]
MSARSSSIEEIKNHWRASKSIETHTPADIDRQLLLLSDDVVMENPMLLHACSTWQYGSSGRSTHYYAAWCRVEAFRVMRDAGMRILLENFLGPEFALAGDGE